MKYDMIKLKENKKKDLINISLIFCIKNFLLLETFIKLRKNKFTLLKN